MATTISKEQYQSHLLRAKQADSWFHFCRLYFKIMKRLEALFLQDIINLAQLNKTKVEWIKEGEESRLFFLCTANYLKKSGSHWTDDEQRRHILSLRKKGYIRSIRRGDDGKRWLHVDLLKLETDLDIAEKSDEGKTPEPESGKNAEPDEGKTPRKERLREERHIVRPSANGASGASPYGRSLTDRMIAELGRKKKIIGKPNLPKSSAEFDQLIQEVKQRDGITFSDAHAKVKRTMNKYLEGIDRFSFWPEAWSGSGFRQKFIQIEAAIKRAEKNGEAERDAPKAKVIHEGNGRTRYVLSLEDN